MNPTWPQDHDQRLQRALLSLDGLSVGDAFGQLLSTSARSVRKILDRGNLPGSGWVEVDDLLQGCAKARRSLTREDLQHIVDTNTKKRFEFSPDGRRIRASQGHSVEVDLAYEPQEPPTVLYHGTATRFLDAIRAQGLLKMQRHHVHLSAETKVTLEVGARHGKPVLLTILAAGMRQAGHVVYRSTNGVWLVERVPVKFIRFPQA